MSHQPLEKCLISGQGQEVYKMRQEHLAIAKRRKLLKTIIALWLGDAGTNLKWLSLVKVGQLEQRK